MPWRLLKTAILRNDSAMAGVTMTQVAKAAGVSVSTVSHVINGTRPVAPETRRAVTDAMDALGFQHRPVARSLAAGSSITIGLAMSTVSSPYWYELVAGLDEEADRHGLQLIMADTREDPKHEERVVANLLAHHVRGLIIAPSHGWQNTTLRLLREHPIPFVVLDRLQNMKVDQVGVENESGSAAIVGHLIQLGHRRIGMITGMAGLSTTEERKAGYVRAHQRAGLQVDPTLMIDGNSSEAGGRKASQQLLALPDRPTAWFVSNDSMTIGALRTLRQARIRIPDDLALVCFDDFPWGDVFEPQLTTVAQPCFAIGARAVQLLVRRMRDPKALPQTLRLNGDVIVRESCGARLKHTT